ncbi:MAG: flagellar basal body P-ring protein FlgI [Candidatus Eremiobacteraeota bacterium]|nr:flagellar basal body P-ring protein FlgI [Candidatus Eremiobacteraeota bacterium]
MDILIRTNVRRGFAALTIATLLSALYLTAPTAAVAQLVRVKDVARVQGVTNNQLVGYGVVTGLGGTGDSTSVIFTSQTIQNVLLGFGLTTTTQAVRTRNVAAVIVTALLPPFAHSGDNVDVLVSSMGDATSLQGGTLVLTELRGPNNLVYATAQGPVSVGGFSINTNGGGAGQNSVSVNFTGAGRVPNGAVIARDMQTNLRNDSAGFNYVLTSPDYKTAARLAQVLNGRFGGIAVALDAEAVHVNLPASYANNQVQFLADAGDLQLNADQIAKVVLNERTGTVVMGGDITLAPCAIAHGNLSITITTTNQFVPPGPFTNAPGGQQTNTRIQATESGRKLIYLSGAPTLAQVVRALNTIGVSPRDLIAIVQALRQAGSLQADVEII